MIVHFLIGLPGAGKSTWLEKETWSGDVIASSDNFIEEYAATLNLTYNDVFKEAIKPAEAYYKSQILKAIDDYENNNFKIYNELFIDRTNISVKSRKKTMEFINQSVKGRVCPVEYRATVFLPDANIWIKRVTNRPGKTIPWNVLTSMAQNFEEPTEAEGFSHINYERNK